jgi:phosphate uptake regulator
MTQEFEVRKVQISGTGTYMISLPKNWVELTGIKNGDSLFLQAQPDGTLLIQPYSLEFEKTPKKEALIEYENSERLIREFIAAYLGGYSQIKIRSKEKIPLKMKNYIRKRSHNMIGLEIMDETPTTITLQDFLDPGDLSPKKGIRRMHLISRSMLQDSIASIMEGDLDLAEEVILRDNDLDRLYWLLAKQYNLLLKNPAYSQKIGITAKEGLYYLLMGRAIERVGDHSSKLAQYGIKLNGKKLPILEEIFSFAQEVRDIFDESINVFQSNQPDKANEIVDNARKHIEIKDQMTKGYLEEKPISTEAVSIAYILDSLGRICSYAMDVGEITIDRKFSE